MNMTLPLAGASLLSADGRTPSPALSVGGVLGIGEHSAPAPCDRLKVADDTIVLSALPQFRCATT